MGQYSPEADAENDRRAKNKLISLFTSHPRYNRKYRLVEPEDKFAVDFHVYHRDSDTHVSNIEVEVKHNWFGETFNFPDIQLLERKSKHWLDPTHNYGLRTMFVMFNRDLSNHLVILAEDAISVYLKNEQRGYAGIAKTRGDKFIICPREIAKFGFFNQPTAAIPANHSQLLF